MICIALSQVPKVLEEKFTLLRYFSQVIFFAFAKNDQFTIFVLVFLLAFKFSLVFIVSQLHDH